MRLVLHLAMLGLLAITVQNAAAQDPGTPQGIPREISPGDVARSADPIDQAPRGLLVRVVNYAGPLAGADVRVRLAGGDKELIGRTGPTGVALLDVQTRGRWLIEVTASEHQAARGELNWPVVAEIEVDLPHERERARGSGQPAEPTEAARREQVAEWLRTGEAAIEQGNHEEGRAALRRAARSLAAEDRAEVMTLIARSFWVEGQRERSVVELERALRIDPEAKAARQVFEALMTALGRADEIDQRLQQIRRGETGPAVDVPTETTVSDQGGAGGTVVSADASTQGIARVRLTGVHELASPEVIARRMHPPKEHRNLIQPIDLAQESFDVFVPEAAASGEAHGLFVWISPGRRGGPPNAAVQEVMTERRMIWIGANDAGNRRSYFDRLALALHAVEGASAVWTIDQSRVVIAGYSGGGRTASMAAWQWPEVFKGAVFWMGTDFYEDIAVPHAPGSAWTARIPKPKRSQLRLIRRESRFVFVTADFDFNRAETKAIHRRAQELGFDEFGYIQIPDTDHYGGLVADALQQAFEFLN